MTGFKLTAVLLSVIGSTLALVGMVLGLLPHSVDFTDCGSAFAPNPHIVFTTECITSTDGARSVALALLIPGLVLAAVGGFMFLFRYQTARDAAVEAKAQTV